MEISFNVNGNSKQLECAKYWGDKTTKDIAYGGSKGNGKSFLGCSLIFADALMYPNTRYFIARKTLSDLRKHTVPSIQEVFNIWGLDDRYWKFNGQDNKYVLYNGSEVYFLDAKYLPSDPLYTRFGSMQMTRGWIEEAGEFEVECKNNLQASIGRWKNDEYGLVGKLLQTCNPAKNYLYEDYYLKWRNNELGNEVKFIQALPTDNKMITRGYLEELERILSPNEKERLLYGNWEFDDNPNVLFDYPDILALYTNEFISEGTDRYITADLAYMGSDKFVIGVWHGMVLVKIYAIDKIEQTVVSKKIHDIRIKHKVPIKNVVYDADGLKMFVRESAKNGYLAGAVQFHNGGKPLKVKGQVENFGNLKTQCAFKLADMVRGNEVFIQTSEYRDEIIREFQQICRLPMKDDTKIYLEKKDDVRKRLKGNSPDFWDMINMRMWFELKGKNAPRILW